MSVQVESNNNDLSDTINDMFYDISLIFNNQRNIIKLDKPELNSQFYNCVFIVIDLLHSALCEMPNYSEWLVNSYETYGEITFDDIIIMFNEGKNFTPEHIQKLYNSLTSCERV